METVLVNKLPDGYFQFAPTEDYLLFTMTQEGPKERKEIYEVLEPDDRQPGWRNRSYLAKYDLKTGLLQPLTSVITMSGLPIFPMTAGIF